MKQPLRLLLSLCFTIYFASLRAQYCTPSIGFYNCTNDYINNFSFNTITNNGSGCSGGGYGNYTAMSTNINAGSTYGLYIQLGGSYSAYIGAWFDWNQDNDFNDPGEFYGYPGLVSSGSIGGISIAVPTTATPGPTRMRIVRKSYSPNVTQADACSMSSYGEYEDYTVVVVKPATHLNFDGTDDYVNLSAASINNLSSGTVETWVYLNSLNDQTICAKQSDFENSYAIFSVGGSSAANGKVFYQSSNSASIVSTTTLNTGQWYHLAVTFNSTSAKLYIDGVLDATASGNFSLPNDITVTATTIGAWLGDGAGQYLNGNLEEFRVWNTVLNAEEILGRKNCELSGTESGLVLYYNFNQGNAMLNNSAYTTLPDESSNSFDGTLTNFALTGASSNWAITSPVTTGITVPAAPITANITYVIGDTPVPLIATGSNLVWYTTPTGGTGSSTAPTPSTGTLGTTSYYVSSTNSNGCEGPRSQLDVTIISSANLATHLSFDGTNDHVTISPSTINNLSTGTIETWIYLNGSDNQTICAKQSNGENSYAIFSVGGGSAANGKIFYQSTNSANIVSTSTLNTGQWYHIAVTFNTTSAKIYVDGVLDATATGNFNLPNDITVTATAIGAWLGSGGGQYLNGSLEEFRVWNIQRSAEEINRTMNCEIPANSTGLVAYYQFNQGWDGIYNPLITTLIDSTSNTFNGTLTNFAVNGNTSNWRAASTISSGVVIPQQPVVSSAALTYCQNDAASQLSATGTNLLWYSSQYGGTGSSVAPTPATTTGGVTSYWVASSNVNGCGSPRTEIQVTIAEPTTGTDVQSACINYTWIDGNTYSVSNNTATHVLTNAAGCDSTVTLNLTIHQPDATTDVQSACNSYTWIDGNTYSTSNNTATHTLTNMFGCDSVITLNLTINNNTGIDFQTACSSYTWIDGNTYTSSNNTATHTLTNSAGCDSVVTLNLTINSPNSGTDVQSACNNYTWIDGNTYTTSNNTATHLLTNSAGCDSLVTLNLTINLPTTGTDVQSACDSYTWIDGNTYTANNSSATFTLTNMAGCDSVVTLNLTIAASPIANAVNNGDGTLYATGTGTYQWINCSTNTVVSGETSATFTPSANGDYAVVVTSGSCNDTSACVTYNSVGLSENGTNQIVVYPNPTNGTLTISFGNVLDNSYIVITNALGELVYSANTSGSSSYELNLEQARGVYFVSIYNEGNLLKTTRVIKN